MKEFEDALLYGLDHAETDEEKHQAIVTILKQRPDIKDFFLELLALPQEDQDEKIHLYNELLKPHEPGKTA